MNNRQELLTILKSYATEWRIEGNSDISLEATLDENFDKLFVDNHHIQEMLDLLKPDSDAATRKTVVKNVMSQSLAFVKGDFHIGDKNVFVFHINSNEGKNKYQTLQKPLRMAYLLKRRRVLARIDQQLDQNPLLILRGKSGIGKSVLAENYYHEYGNEYDFLMWLPYETDLPTTFIRHRDTQISLADLTTELRNLGIPQPEIQRRCAEHIAKVWSDLKGKKLLVLEGVKNADDLQSFIYLFQMLEGGHVLVTTQAFSEGFGACFDAPKLSQTDIHNLAEALTAYEHWDKNDLHLLADNALLLDLTLRQCPTDNPKLAENYLRDLHKVVHTEGGDNLTLDWLTQQAQLSAGHRWILLQWAALPNNRSLESDTFNRICNLERKTIFHSHDFYFFKGHADKQRYKSNTEPFKLADDYQTDLAKRGWLTAHDDDTYSLHPALRQYLIDSYGIDWDYISEQIKSLTTSFFIQEEVGYDDPDDDQSQKCQLIFEEHLWHFMTILKSKNTEGYRNFVAKYIIVLQAQYNMPLLGEWLEKQLELLEEAKGEDAINTCDKRNELGEFYYNTGSYDKALLRFEENLPYYRTLKNRKSEGATLNNLAATALAKGDYDTALRYLEQSLIIIQQIGDRKGEGTVLNNISQIHKARGNYDTALRYLEQSLSIIQQIGDHQGKGVTLHNISQIYDAKGDYDTALRYLEQSLTIMQQIGNRKGEGTTLNNLATTTLAKGDYDTALCYLEQSLNIQQQIGDRKGEGVTLNNLAGIARAKGDYDTALRYLEQSLIITQQIGDIYSSAAILNNMGAIYLNQHGDIENAVKAFWQSYKINKEIGSPDIQYPESYLNDIIECIGEAKFQEIVSKLG